jgi:predicted esterase
MRARVWRLLQRSVILSKRKFVGRPHFRILSRSQSKLAPPRLLRPALSLVFAAAIYYRPACAAAAASRKMMTATHKISSGPRSTLILDPRKGEADALVVLSHGLGDSAEGWIDTAANAIAPRLPSVRFVLPTAPTQPVTVNGGYAMPSWYDIESLGKGRDRTQEKAKGIEASQATLLKIIDDAKAKGIPPERIILAGFSQGGALSLFTGLSYPGRLGGIVVLSAYLPVPGQVKPHPAGATLDTPVLFCHGDEDDVVPLDAGRDAERRVKAFGVKDVTFNVVEGMGHGADADEIKLVTAWIKKVLAEATPAPAPAAPAAATAAAEGTASVASSGEASTSSGGV